jgi:YbgC/YbaW family acyl-CoA thioester hydrolase
MARTKIEIPDTFSFQTEIPVRITDLNYGGHVGNDTFLSIIHEARLQFFKHYNFSEMDIDGTATIMSDANILYKNQVFYGSLIRVQIKVTELSKKRFEMVYLLTDKHSQKEIARIQTGMVFFDYDKQKIAAMPEVFKKTFTSAS